MTALASLRAASPLAFALAAVLVPGASAQTLLVDQGKLVAWSGMPAPGLPGATLADTFGDAFLDASGQVVVRARLLGAGVTFNDDVVLLRGFDSSSLAIHLREGAPAPSLPGVVLRAGADGIGTAYRVTGSGRIQFYGRLFGPGITSANDHAIFSGTPGAAVLVAQEGTPAPGTAGALFLTNFADQLAEHAWTNDAGGILFFAALTGGDVVGTTNTLGVWAGTPGAVQLVLRTGMQLNGGPVIATLVSNGSILNAAGQTLSTTTFSTTLGTPPATISNDSAILIGTPGVGVQFLAREGDPAPGTVGAHYGAQMGGFGFGLSPRAFDAGARVLFEASTAGGDVVPFVNEHALFLGAPGSVDLLVRAGDVAPSSSGLAYWAFDNPSLCLNEGGFVAFGSDLIGPVLIEDHALFAGRPGSIQRVAGWGDAAPGTAGAQLHGIPGANLLLNERDELLFETGLAPGIGDTTPARDQMIFHWGVHTGLRPVLREGDVLSVPPGVPKTVASWTLPDLGSGNSQAMNFKDSGAFALRVLFSDGSEAVYVVAANAAGEAFCAGDGALADHTTPCPCGNNGAAGQGCAHSFSVAGGDLVATGSAEDDSVLLAASNLPASSFTLFLQHDAPGDTVFHDGVLCAGGTLIRLRGRNAVAGAASFPNPSFANDATTTLAQRGSVTIGSGALRFYSAWYRNASTSFCPPATANVTNGWRIVW